MSPGRVIIPLLCLIYTLNVEALISQPYIPNQGAFLETVKQWNLLTYNFQWDAPSDNRNYFNPENVVATGIAIDRNRIFVATPKLYSGVPATLSTIPRGNFGDSPVLRVSFLFFKQINTVIFGCLGILFIYFIGLPRLVPSHNRPWSIQL